MHDFKSADVVEMSVMELHRRLRHISVASTCKLVTSRAVQGIELNPNSKEVDCNVCTFVHTTCLPMSKPCTSIPTQNFGDEVHTDVWGPLSIAMHQGQRYFASFTDDCTCFTVIFLLRTKDKAFDAYKTFEAWATTQLHCKAIKCCAQHSEHPWAMSYSPTLPYITYTTYVCIHCTYIHCPDSERSPGLNSLYLTFVSIHKYQ
jgi:hypothetical protein